MIDFYKNKVQWREASESPDIFQPIVCWTRKGKIISLKDTKGFYGGKDEPPYHSNFPFYREKYGILFWIYQEEIKPDRLK